MNYIVSQLPAHLFWDSDIAKLDDVEQIQALIDKKKSKDKL